MFAAQRIPYQLTNSFSNIVLDYLNNESSLNTFYGFEPTLNGIKSALEKKQKQKIDRNTLVTVLRSQYEGLEKDEKVDSNINLLLQDNTFSICTAHQPNLFTGPLYFIYKIVHAIKLADELKKQLPDFSFVPVFYMGSEDADFLELNHFNCEGKRYEWTTKQTGAVGRMVVDNQLIKLMDELENQLLVQSFGKEWIDLLRQSYKNGVRIQDATLQVIHHLFAKFGLVVLIADHPELKKTMYSVFENDLFLHQPFDIVTQTGNKLQENYTAQAHAREINLFYLKDTIRERIEKKGDKFVVCNTSLSFTADEIKKELELHPEHFSPNVILRGLFQETILPNVAFIGGGGEIAYWLQLADLFKSFQIPFPVLILRNSFSIIEQKHNKIIKKLGLDMLSVFQPYETLINDIVLKNSSCNLTINDKIEHILETYQAIAEQTKAVDISLVKHVEALKTQAVQKLKDVEKKMLRAEKRKFKDQQNQLTILKSNLFPKNGLQERVENVGYYYSKWGKQFIAKVYELSPSLEQKFTVLTTKD